MSNLVAGTDLFRVAVAAYGDASLWYKIAQANGIIDPVITQPQVVTVPPAPAVQSNGGILNFSPVPGGAASLFD